jgi:hypothetical protein
VAALQEPLSSAAQSEPVLHWTQVPAMFEFEGSPHTWFGGLLSPVQSKPAGSNEKLGASGEPVQAPLNSHSVVGLGTSVESSIDVTPPLPSQTSCWQSPDVWPVESTWLFPRFDVPHTLVLQVATTHSLPVAGQSVATLHATQAPLPLQTVPPLSVQWVVFDAFVVPQMVLLQVLSTHAEACGAQSPPTRHATQVPLSQTAPPLSVQVVSCGAFVVPQQPVLHELVLHAEGWEAVQSVSRVHVVEPTHVLPLLELLLEAVLDAVLEAVLDAVLEAVLDAVLEAVLDAVLDAVLEATVLLEEPPVLLEEPPVLLEEPPVLLEEPPVLLEEPPVLLEEPPVLVVEPPVLLVEEPPVLLVEPPAPPAPPALLVEPPEPPVPGILLRSTEAMSSQPVTLTASAPAVRSTAVTMFICLFM